MNYKILPLAALTAILCAHRGVQAEPQQTVENAEKFLTYALKGTRISLKSQGEFAYIRIDDLSYTEKCKIDTVYVQNDKGEYLDRKLKGSIDFKKMIEVSANNEDVVYKVRAASIQELTISTGSKSMAARVAYAMDFIRRDCDPTESTGF